eukprot:GILI01007685.1.p1 GENE.GILI01007685.1~~GILI01007685.1.p1  ORF type:complete len:820 (+),score=183.62 GILI01007685.1:1-2460(+)
MHHSRNTVEKEWSGSKVLILQLLSRLFRSFYALLRPLSNYSLICSKMLHFLEESVCSKTEEVAVAGVKAVHDFLLAQADVATPALDLTVWDGAWNVLSRLSELASSPAYSLVLPEKVVVMFLELAQDLINLCSSHFSPSTIQLLLEIINNLMVVPSVCPMMPSSSSAASHHAVSAPFARTNVLHNGSELAVGARIGAASANNPGSSSPYSGLNPMLYLPTGLPVPVPMTRVTSVQRNIIAFLDTLSSHVSAFAARSANVSTSDSRDTWDEGTRRSVERTETQLWTSYFSHLLSHIIALTSSFVHPALPHSSPVYTCAPPPSLSPSFIALSHYAPPEAHEFSPKMQPISSASSNAALTPISLPLSAAASAHASSSTPPSHFSSRPASSAGPPLPPRLNTALALKLLPTAISVFETKVPESIRLAVLPLLLSSVSFMLQTRYSPILGPSSLSSPALESFVTLVRLGLQSLDNHNLSEEKLTSLWTLLTDVLHSVLVPDPSVLSRLPVDVLGAILHENEQADISLVNMILTELLPHSDHVPVSLQWRLIALLDAGCSLHGSLLSDEHSGSSTSVPSGYPSSAPVPGTFSSSSASSHARMLLYRQSFTQTCVSNLFKLCASPSTSGSDPLPASSSSASSSVTLNLSPSSALRVARMAAPVLMARCGEVIRRYVVDERQSGHCPLPRNRLVEVLFIITQLRALKLHPGVLLPPDSSPSSSFISPSSSFVSPATSFVTPPALESAGAVDSSAEAEGGVAYHPHPTPVLSSAGLVSHKVLPSLKGNNAHLLHLFPQLCECITAKEPELKELLRDIFHDISRELGLE